MLNKVYPDSLKYTVIRLFFKCAFRSIVIIQKVDQAYVAELHIYFFYEPALPLLRLTSKISWLSSFTGPFL